MPPSQNAGLVDAVRKSRIQQALREANLEVVICALPSNVLLLSGYWPVLGASVAICFREGPTILLVPEDEQEIAETGFADSIKLFTAATLDAMETTATAVRPLVLDALKRFSPEQGVVGVESGESSQAAPYLAMHLFGNDLGDILRDILPDGKIVAADELLRNLKAIKSPREMEKIRAACLIAKNSFEVGAPYLRAGMDEPEAAELFRATLTGTAASRETFKRCDGFAFCMSGPNAAKACAAYARTRNRVLQQDDTVMIHCNSYVDGFWTDITRTYTLQTPDEAQNNLRAAVMAARSAALEQIKPGAKAADVDAASKRVIRNYGLGEYLRHGTGHGVGYSPMDAYSLPKLHSQSSDILQEGMVFNVEPAVYVDGYGGVRHCDMVAVTASGYELFTDFQIDAASLTLANASPPRTRLVQSGSPS